MVASMDELTMVAQAQQFSLVHGYAHLEGSPASRRDQHMSREYFETLKAHDRRRLAAVVDFPLTGDDDPFVTGLYYTKIYLGTPPVGYYVQVDTGSDVTWLNCAPCTSCVTETQLPSIKLTTYDPSRSSTDGALSCRDSNCGAALGSNEVSCTSAGYCAYSTTYGDGSSTQGYFIQDVMTFQEIHNNTQVNGTASVYFGCGTTQSGNLLMSSRALDGLIGFGQAAVSIPSQLASMGKVGNRFAHCLQGDNQGGGTIVIGSVSEPNISYTPIVSRNHYAVGMQNIAVNGRNVTTPASFDTTSTSAGGVIMDSGTTLAYLVDPAYTQFVNAIVAAAPVPVTVVTSSSSESICWIYTGDLQADFPTVKLFFDAGAVMNLTPRNYLYSQPLQNGQAAYCMGWQKSTTKAGYLSYSILGDIVLKDHLVVYDNDNRVVGWKSFDCTKSIRVSADSSTSPNEVMPKLGASGAGASREISTHVLLLCLLFAMLSIYS